MKEVMDEKTRKYGPVIGAGVLTEEGYVDAKEYMLDLQGADAEFEKNIINTKGLLLISAFSTLTTKDARKIKLAISEAVSEINEERQQHQSMCFHGDLFELRQHIAVATLLGVVSLLAGLGVIGYLIFR